MTTVVISQPMLFPWVGMFEQICLADKFIYYDDVQFSKGSFTNRVQLKGKKCSEWMTIPLEKIHLGQNINEVIVSSHTDWRKKHMGQLEHCYAQAKFFNEMIELVESVYDIQSNSLSEITMASMNVICNYFGLKNSRTFHLSSDHKIKGKSSERVLNYVLHFGGSRYVTGLGALNYLNHELFEDNGVNVVYMDYRKKAYAQLFGQFNAYISILDLVANCGREGEKYLCPNSIDWRKLK